MNFLDVLLHPDREELENGPRLEIATAANILQVGEFQLLQLAYHEWFRQDLPEHLLDRMFSDYMLRNMVPGWARHYARRIVALDAAGRLDVNDPAYHRYDHDFATLSPRGMRLFLKAAAIVLVVMGGGIYLAQQAASDGSVSILPPFFTPQELTTKANGSDPRPAAGKPPSY